jgi:hypothetical protein
MIINKSPAFMQVIFVKYYISNQTDEPEAMRFSAFKKRLSCNIRDVIKVNSVANSGNIWYWRSGEVIEGLSHIMRF